MIITYLYRKYKERSQQPKSAEHRNHSPSFCPHSKDTKAQRCETCATDKADNAAARKYRWKLLLLLLPGFLLASLDLTIVATALPFIASQFNKLNQLNWIVTAFALTETTFMPVFGQLSDTFGRHSAIQISILFLTIGSVLCAAAPIWAVLLLGRALQGVGTAGVVNVTMIILADSVSLKEQALNTSIFQFLQGIGYSIGPVIGGYIVDSNWRYSFVLCAGLGVVAIVCVFFLRSDLKPGSISISHPANDQTRFGAFVSGFSTLDFGGVFLFLFGIGLVILGTAWGGSTYAWNSAAVITSLVLGGILISLFVIYEKLLEPGYLLSRTFPKTIPLIPYSVLRNEDVGLICFMAAGAGAAFSSVFYFIGIYFTLAEAYPASRAGINLLYYIPGIGAGAIIAIYLCNYKPRQTFWPLFLGTIVETGAMAALAYAVKQRHSTLVNVMMGVAGAGTGVRFMPFNLHLAGMFRDKLAPVYSLLRFAMPFGGTLALTVMGSVFQNQMAVYFGPDVAGNGNGGEGLNLHTQAALDAVSRLPPAQQEAVRSKGAEATMWAFISILPFLGMSVVASTGLGNVWISKREESTAASEAEGGEIGEDGSRDAEPEKEGRKEKQERTHPEILTGVYLLALWQGKVRAQRKPGPTETGPVSEVTVRNSEAGNGVDLMPRSGQ